MFMYIRFDASADARLIFLVLPFYWKVKEEALNSMGKQHGFI